MDLFKMLGDALNPQNMKKPVDFAAIWLNNKITTGTGEAKLRITNGDLLRVENNEIVNCSMVENEWNWTHKVIGTQGYLDNSELWFILSDRENSINIKIIP